MKTDIEIITAKDIIEIYGFPWNYTYKLLQTKGCPILPRKRNQPYRLIKDEFEKWLRKH